MINRIMKLVKKIVAPVFSDILLMFIKYKFKSNWHSEETAGSFRGGKVEQM